MGEESLKYFDLVYKVLTNWYVKFAQLTPKLLVGIIVFIFFLTFSKFLSRIAVNLFQKFFPNNKASGSVVALVGVFRFLIMLMGTFISLEIMGFSGFFIKFLGSLGVAGVIAGVALKDIVSSMFSGMLVGIDKAFKVGDYVTIGAHSGTVQEIGFLTTKLLTDDGKKVYVPNQIIFNAPFYNVTASPQRKIIFNFNIPADEDISKAIVAVKEALKTIDSVDNVDDAEVIITNLADGAFTLQTKFSLTIGASILKVKSEAYLKIKKYLDDNQIRLETPTNINMVNNNNPI